MIALVRRNLSSFILKHTAPFVCRSPSVSHSSSLHFFSTSEENKLGTSSNFHDLLVHKHYFPSELASRVASQLSYLKNPGKADSVLSFLKEGGFSNAQLVKIVNYKPRLLGASIESAITPKIKILLDVGISSRDVCKIISINPTILFLSIERNILPSLSVLKGFLVSNDQISSAIKRCPWLITSNLGNCLVPNVKFLKSCGVPMERIRIILHSSPACFIAKPEILRRHVEKAKEMGFDASSTNFIYAISSLSRMSKGVWERKLQGFRDMGFSDSDIVTIFRKCPSVFNLSVEKISNIRELLLATWKFDMSSILDCPSSLSYSIEQRYKPRLRILGILESRNLIKEWPSLGIVATLSENRFFDRYISPYSDEVWCLHHTEFYSAVAKNRGEALSKS